MSATFTIAKPAKVAQAAKNSINNRTLQDRALALLRKHKGKGVTSADLMNRLGVHHGTASGVMTTLHVHGQVVRLSEKRGGRKIYVLPEWTRGRATEEPGQTAKSILMDDMVTYLDSLGTREAAALVDRFYKIGY